MARVFQTDFNTNLRPDFFEKPHPVEPKFATPDSESKCTIDNKYRDNTLYNQDIKKNYASKALAGIQEVSPFSFLYFSSQNIEALQKLIRYNVYIHTNKEHVIGYQNETELVIVMRAIYLQYAKVPAHPTLFKAEIERLNAAVVTQILPDLVSNVKQYVGYIRDSSRTALPMDRGVNASIKGERTLRSVSDVLVGDDLFFQM